MRFGAILAIVLAWSSNASARSFPGRDHRSMQTLSLWLMGGGGVMLAGGGLALKTASSTDGSILPGALLVSAGSLSLLGGAGLCWSGSRADAKPPKWLAAIRTPDLVAGLDPKRGSDLGFRLPVWRVSF